MNIEELENKVKELQEEIENLKKEENKSLKRWRAKKNDGYYILIDSGQVVRVFEDNHCIDDFRYNTGNYFENEQEAENYKEKLLIYQELKDLAIELNNGKKINWEADMQYKYYITIDGKLNNLVLNSAAVYKGISQIYCLTRDFLNIAKVRIGEERLKKLFEEE